MQIINLYPKNRRGSCSKNSKYDRILIYIICSTLKINNFYKKLLIKLFYINKNIQHALLSRSLQKFNKN